MELIDRKEYVNWLLGYKDKKVIKVLTGLRRVGKSTIFTLYINELKKLGVTEEQIIFLNFEELENNYLLDKIALNNYIIERKIDNKKLYVFLDEVQKIEGFEEVVDSLFVKDYIDLYITGSNAKFLSSEIATLLTGRYVQIHILPISFAEYYENFGGENKDKNELFNNYITYGAMPGSFMFNNGSSEQREYIESIYSTILEKDILKRNTNASKQIVENILNYLIYNIGCLTSTKRITDTLCSNNVKTSYNTVSSYFETLQDCYFVYKADRYDVVGKEYLKLINKYYVADFGFRHYILNNSTLEISQLLENLVFLELKRRRYKIATGKVDNKEVDFIIKDNEENLIYIQVAVTLLGEEKLKQELAVFESIHDNYPKYLITIDNYFVSDRNGIKTINAIDFLLGKKL